MNIETFAIIGMIFGTAALYKVIKIERMLKAKGVINDDQ